MRIRESNGTFKVTITSLAGQEVAIYREGSGSLTFELREVEEDYVLEDLQFERVPIFRGEAEAVAVQEEAVKKEAVQKDVIKEETVTSFEKEYAKNNTLFHKLSDLRRQLATEQNVPPYLIFHDKALWGMVETMPADLSAMGKISGIGKAKLEKYGVMFLSVLKSA